MALNGTRIVPADYLGYVLYWANSSYMFGRKAGSASKLLWRVDSDYVGTQLIDVTTLTDQGAVSFVDGVVGGWDSTIFMLVKNGTTGRYYLFKSVDNGVSFGANAPSYNDGNWVAEVGKLGATHTPDIAILGNRGFCVATIGGERVLFYGEYNIASGRVSGGDNDWVRVMRSDDDGDTWSAMVAWNTSGHQTRHCHFVAQDPYDGKIYVGLGDSAAEVGIIQWDGSSAWADNLDIADFNSRSGFRSFADGKRYACTNLLFTESYVYNLTDTGAAADNAERGIWRFPRDFSDYTRVDNQNTEVDGHSMYWGLVTSGGSLLAAELLENGTATDQTIYLYTSSDGVTWHKAGAFLCSTTVGTSVNRAPSGLFEWNGKVYLAATRGAGKNDIQTTIFEMEDAFSGDPEVVHPVYWVSASGSDSNDGYRPGTAWASLGRALTGNRATDGARVILGAGTFYQAKITAAWSANALPAESGNEMVIEGAGNTTILRVYDAQPKLLAQNANGGPVQFRELWINDHQPAAFVTDIAEFSDDTEGTVSLENVRLGWDGSALKGPRVT